jgi:hypothetical protein
MLDQDEKIKLHKHVPTDRLRGSSIAVVGCRRNRTWYGIHYVREEIHDGTRFTRRISAEGHIIWNILASATTRDNALSFYVIESTNFYSKSLSCIF